jgi:indole-3-glycerol phosphate synthase
MFKKINRITAMTILDTIIARKKIEVNDARSERPLRALESAEFFRRQCISATRSINASGAPALIAEFKRRSPSKGVLHPNPDREKIIASYANNGAAAISILTDSDFFGGSAGDLKSARQHDVALLRKDFIIDEYQVYETKAMGADLMLLIAACLSTKDCSRLAAIAKSIGLEVLLEVHDESELEHINEHVDLVGVNNRDLKNFNVDISRSLNLIEKIPAAFTAVSESGISKTETIHELYKAGFKGFLIGENFMKEPDPAIAFASFVQRLKKPEQAGSNQT